MSYLLHVGTLLILLYYFWEILNVTCLNGSTFLGLKGYNIFQGFRNCVAYCSYLVAAPFYACDFWSSYGFFAIMYVIVSLKFYVKYCYTIMLDKFSMFCSGVDPRFARMQRPRNTILHCYHRVTSNFWSRLLTFKLFLVIYAVFYAAFIVDYCYIN